MIVTKILNAWSAVSERAVQPLRPMYTFFYCSLLHFLHFYINADLFKSVVLNLWIESYPIEVIYVFIPFQVVVQCAKNKTTESINLKF